jgi:hypothetical protein
MADIEYRQKERRYDPRAGRRAVTIACLLVNAVAVRVSLASATAAVVAAPAITVSATGTRPAHPGTD